MTWELSLGTDGQTRGQTPGLCFTFYAIDAASEHNKSVFSLIIPAVNMALPAFAAERRAASSCCGAVAAEQPAPSAVDRYLLPAGRSAANPPHAAATVER